jgi:hypothetical protein
MKYQCTATALTIRSLPEVKPGTDLGKRVFKRQVVESWGLSHDGKWAYVDAPAGRGWVSLQYLELIPEAFAPAIVSSGGWPRVPKGKDEIIEIFGQPGKPLCYAGRVKLPATLKLSWANESIQVLACHKLMEDVFTSVFQTLFDKGMWEQIVNFGGIYNDRSVKGSSKVSTHAWGISVDIDTLNNPLGKAPKMDLKLVKVFEDHGFEWGGRWTRPDGMHHQYARGY